MDKCKLYSAGRTPALECANRLLKSLGVTLLPRPNKEVTHLLLPTPSFEPDGSIKGGGSLPELLVQLPKDITVIGGGLNRPELENYTCIDLLQDPLYTAQNANITAHCALRLALNNLPVIIEGQQVLIIGWGRIGKCLARLLKNIGAQVCIAARKASDRAMITALGYRATDIGELNTQRYRVIFNTVPEMVCSNCPGTGLKIDLASKSGLGGSDVIWARGLPGKDAPESSGQLIANTVIRLISRKE